MNLRGSEREAFFNNTGGHIFRLVGCFCLLLFGFHWLFRCKWSQIWKKKRSVVNSDSLSWKQLQADCYKFSLKNILGSSSCHPPSQPAKIKAKMSETEDLKYIVQRNLKRETKPKDQYNTFRPRWPYRLLRDPTLLYNPIYKWHQARETWEGETKVSLVWLRKGFGKPSD